MTWIRGYANTWLFKNAMKVELMSYCLASRVTSNGWFTVKNEILGANDTILHNIEGHSVWIKLVLNNFLPIFKLSLRKYKSFSHLWGIKLIFVKFTHSLLRLRSERITQKRVARLVPGFVRECHICEVLLAMLIRMWWS